MKKAALPGRDMESGYHEEEMILSIWKFPSPKDTDDRKWLGYGSNMFSQCLENKSGID